MKRTFIAVPVAAETRHVLEKINTDLHHLSKKVKFVEPHNAHLTLKFLGDTPEDRFEMITRLIQQVTSDISSFDFTCQGTGAFPNSRQARVFWLGCEESSGVLHRLSQQLDKVLVGLGFATENRPFRFHLTIARVRQPLTDAEIASFMEYDYPAVHNRVDRVIWFESTLLPGGPHYRPIKTFDLKGKES